jgi:ribosomal protein S18 acetylase RimI-like enzyme
MLTQVLVRQADPAEAPALGELVERAYAVYVGRIGRRPAPMDDDYEAKARRGEAFVADDGSIAGLIVLVEHPDHFLVENVAVDPARQGTGVGRALLAYAERHAAAHGLRELRLYTNEAMTENLTLYPHLGYREVGRRVEDGFRRVYYSKQLPDA